MALASSLFLDCIFKVSTKRRKSKKKKDIFLENHYTRHVLQGIYFTWKQTEPQLLLYFEENLPFQKKTVYCQFFPVQVEYRFIIL